jgi:hypothetical protein
VTAATAAVFDRVGRVYGAAQFVGQREERITCSQQARQSSTGMDESAAKRSSSMSACSALAAL